MKSIINKELIEIIQYHIDNKMLLRVERSFDGETDVIQGFPIAMSQKLLFMTVINDFHDEGFAILRLTDVSDAYSKESDTFYEKICTSEKIGIEISDIVQEITDLTTVLKQLIKYEGFISVQCENQLERCTFYLGKIKAVEQDGIVFKDIDMDGRWDNESHKIIFDEIAQITYGDNYSKMFYKYVKNK